MDDSAQSAKQAATVATVAKDPPMAVYNQRSDKPLTAPQAIALAWDISRNVHWQSEFVLNKHIHIMKRVRAARSKQECSEILIRYYPLRGISQPLINLLVDQLGLLDLASFQALVSRLLVYYSADSSAASLIQTD